MAADEEFVVHKQVTRYTTTRLLTCFWFDPKVSSPGPTTREHEGCEPTPGDCRQTAQSENSAWNAVNIQVEVEKREEQTWSSSPGRNETEERLWAGRLRIFAGCALFHDPFLGNHLSAAQLTSTLPLLGSGNNRQPARCRGAVLTVKPFTG
ncbi:hypothetical protein C8R46DRAFT_398405 [Mycena filopes]|nr:hypothetical protein C8R46DRAFT_398405 [Mycena filopes]